MSNDVVSTFLMCDEEHDDRGASLSETAVGAAYTWLVKKTV